MPFMPFMREGGIGGIGGAGVQVSMVQQAARVCLTDWQWLDESTGSRDWQVVSLVCGGRFLRCSYQPTSFLPA